MINFEQLSRIVPDQGQLVLIFQKNKDGLEVFIAPKYKGKETNPDLGPFRIKGAPAAMRDKFTRYVTEVAPLEQQIASGPDEVEKRKEKLASHASGRVKPEAKPPTKKKEPEKKPAPEPKKKGASLEGTFFERKPKAAKEPEAETKAPAGETESQKAETPSAEPETETPETGTQDCGTCESGQCETCGKSDPSPKEETD